MLRSVNSFSEGETNSRNTRRSSASSQSVRAEDTFLTVLLLRLIRYGRRRGRRMGGSPIVQSPLAYLLRGAAYSPNAMRRRVKEAVMSVCSSTRENHQLIFRPCRFVFPHFHSTRSSVKRAWHSIECISRYLVFDRRLPYEYPYMCGTTW